MNEVKTSLMLKFSLQNFLQSFESLLLIWCNSLPLYDNLINERQMCLLLGFWLQENLSLSYFLMTLLNENDRYAFLTRLDLMLSMSI